jgi:integrase
MAYLLGWRRGELSELRVSNVDIIDRIIRIDDSKNGDARETPMTERLAMLIQQLISGKQADEKIFPSRATIERKWKKIRAAAGCAKVKMHDWRRTSARTKRAAGVPEGVIMDLMGWKTAAMFRRYAIVNQDDERRALDLVESATGQSARNPHNSPLPA